MDETPSLPRFTVEIRSESRQSGHRGTNCSEQSTTMKLKLLWGGKDKRRSAPELSIQITDL